MIPELNDLKVIDLHTHLYPASFGTPSAGDKDGLMLWGIDELLTFHYIAAEFFRITPRDEIAPADFFALSKSDQADRIWQALFVDRTPNSAACRGAVHALTALGLDPCAANLTGIRSWFSDQDPDAHTDRVMEMAGVEKITMTNDPFDDNERERWLNGARPDSRFDPVLRIDPLVCSWPAAAEKLTEWGYECRVDFGGGTFDAVKRFLSDWIDRMNPVYVACSLPPTFSYDGPDDLSDAATNLRGAILPLLKDRGLAMGLMIGARRQTNPELGLAGDSLGVAEPHALARLARDFPNSRFLVTMLARENQHELISVARKFGNILPFGCWWFLNTPQLIREITDMRLELLGTSFVPQHSDARVLEQLIYKWSDARRIVGEALSDSYLKMSEAGREVRPDEIERDCRLLFRDNYLSFIQT